MCANPQSMSDEDVPTVEDSFMLQIGKSEEIDGDKLTRDAAEVVAAIARRSGHETVVDNSVAAAAARSAFVPPPPLPPPPSSSLPNQPVSYQSSTSTSTSTAKRTMRSIFVMKSDESAAIEQVHRFEDKANQFLSSGRDDQRCDAVRASLPAFESFCCDKIRKIQFNGAIENCAQRIQLDYWHYASHLGWIFDRIAADDKRVARFDALIFDNLLIFDDLFESLEF